MNVKVLKNGKAIPLEELGEQEQKEVRDQMDLVSGLAELNVTEADEIRWAEELRVSVRRDDLANLVDWAWDLPDVPKETKEILERFNRLIIERDKNGKLSN